MNKITNWTFSDPIRKLARYICGIRNFYLIVQDLNWGRFGFVIVCGHFDLGTFFYFQADRKCFFNVKIDTVTPVGIGP